MALDRQILREEPSMEPLPEEFAPRRLTSDPPEIRFVSLERPLVLQVAMSHQLVKHAPYIAVVSIHKAMYH